MVKNLLNIKIGIFSRFQFTQIKKGVIYLSFKVLDFNFVLSNDWMFKTQNCNENSHDLWDVGGGDNLGNLIKFSPIGLKPKI